MLIGISASELLEDMPSSKKECLDSHSNIVLFISGSDDLTPIPIPLPL